MLAFYAEEEEISPEELLLSLLLPLAPPITVPGAHGLPPLLTRMHPDDSIYRTRVVRRWGGGQPLAAPTARYRD